MAYLSQAQWLIGRLILVTKIVCNQGFTPFYTSYSVKCWVNVKKLCIQVMLIFTNFHQDLHGGKVVNQEDNRDHNSPRQRPGPRPLSRLESTHPSCPQSVIVIVRVVFR